jgi:pimeloyl-ACP methyl ester carboxylesterase
MDESRPVSKHCLAALLRCACLLAALSCTGCFYSGPIGSANRPNVVVLRGPGGYFPNLMDLENRLVDEGVCPTVAYPDAEAKIAERIIGGKNQGRWSGPIVIVGYSTGADAAISLSHRLAVRGVEVEKLVLLEAAGDKPVPPNVHACLNIYKSQPWSEYAPIFAGKPLRAANESTEVVNYDLRDYNDGRYDWENHFSVSANPHVQELIVDEVLVAFDAEPAVPTTTETLEVEESEPDAGGKSESARAEPVPMPAAR